MRWPALGIATVALTFAAGTTPAQQAFDVVSIKANPERTGSLKYEFGPSLFSMRARIVDLVRQAWDFEAYQIAGGPPWAQSDWYDIQARAPQPVDKPVLRLMIQSMLADRFQLHSHLETRTMQGYALSVDKGGPKLPAPIVGVEPGTKGVIQVGGGVIWARGATIGLIANGLHIELGQPVIDETKIAGNYDFKLRFDEGNPDLAMPGRDTPGVGSVFGAVKEYGLRLDAKKVPIQVLVIDSVEKPAEN